MNIDAPHQALATLVDVDLDGSRSEHVGVLIFISAGFSEGTEFEQ